MQRLDITYIAGIALVGLGTVVVEAIMPGVSWLLYILLGVISILLMLLMYRYLFKIENRSLTNTDLVIVLLALFFWGAFFLHKPNSFWLSCMSETEAHMLISNGAGKQENAGRRKAIECLVRDGENLERLNIGGARLGKLEVPGAKMPGAIMTNARLNEANFRGANLGEAILSGAELSGADFRGANLNNAALGNLKWGDVIYGGADLSGAWFDENTELKNAHLYGVRGLTCEQLTKAKNWQTTTRTLYCGQPIPEKWMGAK